MGILIWIFFGGLVGWVASLIMKTDAQQGVALNVVVGIIGAFLGGFIMNLVGQGGVRGFTVYSFIVALIGAVVLIWIVKMLRN